MSDTRLTEIVTRAVVGRADHRMAWDHTVPAEGVTGVLGVHVTDYAVAVKEKDRRAVVDVLVDLDLWCGNAKTTKVLRCTARHAEALEIRTTGQVMGQVDLTAKLTDAVRATGVKVDSDGVTLSLEADVSVEMSALTRMWVKAYQLDDDALDDVDDPWDDESGSGSGSGSGLGE